MYSYLKGANLSKHIKVGQTVYVVPTGNMMRGMDGESFDYIKEEVVLKVGRKYFYLLDNSRAKCGIGQNDRSLTDISDYSPNYVVFLSIEDVEKAKELDNLNHVGYDIKRFWSRFSIEDKRIFSEIVNKYRKSTDET